MEERTASLVESRAIVIESMDSQQRSKIG